MLDNLPHEMQLYIYNYLDIRDIYILMISNKSLYYILFNIYKTYNNKKLNEGKFVKEMINFITTYNKLNCPIYSKIISDILNTNININIYIEHKLIDKNKNYKYLIKYNNYFNNKNLLYNSFNDFFVLI